MTAMRSALFASLRARLACGGSAAIGGSLRGMADKKIAVLTSGGDSPGMNASIRAAAKVAGVKGVRLVGVEHGYDGLIDGRFRDLTMTLSGGGIAPLPEIDT